MNTKSVSASLRRDKPILGLTLGDPAGIGPEICLRALRAPGRAEPVRAGGVR